MIRMNVSLGLEAHVYEGIWMSAAHLFATSHVLVHKRKRSQVVEVYSGVQEGRLHHDCMSAHGTALLLVFQESHFENRSQWKMVGWPSSN